MSSSHKDENPLVPEGGQELDKCPYCKGAFPKSLPLVNGETQLQRHVKVFHRQYANNL